MSFFNMCEGKIAYDSKSEANKYKVNLKRKSKMNINTYLCEYCNKYHFGNSRGLKKPKRK